MSITKNEYWSAGTFFDRILQLCEQYEWTLNRLAELSGVTPSTLYTYRYRKSLPKLETVIAVSDAFGISLSEFFIVGDAKTDELYKILNGLSLTSKELLKEVAKRMKS